MGLEGGSASDLTGVIDMAGKKLNRKKTAAPEPGSVPHPNNEEGASHNR
jgi:hypothetical protein